MHFFKERNVRLKKRAERNSYFDYLDVNTSIAPKLQEKEGRLVSGFKEKITSLIDEHKWKVKYAKAWHEGNLGEYSKNARSILLWLCPAAAVVSLIAFRGFGNNFLLFSLPILLVVLGSFSYFVSTKTKSKQEMENKVSKHFHVLEKASIYLREVREL